MARKPRLFISHSSGDNEVAKTLYAELCGPFDVFLDAYDLRVGDKWQDGIEAEIAGCHCAVVLLSPNVRAKPDWVNAEAYAFSLRLRVFDPSFRMVPVLLDGFTDAELAAGPLAKSKLAEIQAPKMTSAALDVPAILVGLRPVLEQFEALLPFEQVARAVASIIGGLDPNAQEIIADAIGIKPVELQGAINRSRWLAAGLLKSKREDLERAHRALAAVAAEPAKQIFRIVAPYAWVDRGAAGQIMTTGLAVPPKPALAMNATRRETPRLYVRRASLKVPEWTTFDCDGDFGSAGTNAPRIEEMILGNIRQALATKLGFGPTESPTDAEINAELDAALPDEPVFVLLPPWFAAMDPKLLPKLGVFPRVVFLIWTEKPLPELETETPQIVKRLPDLDEAEERGVYRMYSRCIPAGEPLL